MGQRARVFNKLTGPERAHVLDALHAARAHVPGKLLVAEDGQPSFNESWNQSRQVTRSPVQL